MFRFGRLAVGLSAGGRARAIVAVVGEIGCRVSVATPSIDALLGLTRRFVRVRGLYPQRR